MSGISRSLEIPTFTNNHFPYKMCFNVDSQENISSDKSCKSYHSLFIITIKLSLIGTRGLVDDGIA